MVPKSAPSNAAIEILVRQDSGALIRKRIFPLCNAYKSKKKEKKERKYVQIIKYVRERSLKVLKRHLKQQATPMSQQIQSEHYRSILGRCWCLQ